MHAPEFYDSPALYTTPGPEHRIYMNDTKVAKPTGTQVLIHVKATGVCGSDVHFWKHGGIGPMQVKKDCGLGHESSGIVEAVGPDVTLWKIGDRVAIEPGVPCVSPTPGIPSLRSNDDSGKTKLSFLSHRSV
jgi:L-iditol 2-dehydrogenase